MQVTKNERMLLALLAAIAFLGGNFFGYRNLVQKQTTQTLLAAQLRADQAEARVDLQELDKWTPRLAWIKSQQPAATDEGDAKGQMLEYVLKGARDNQLEIQEQGLDDVEHGPGGTRVNVSVKVKGPMESIVKWLIPFEKTDQFYAVSSFSLKADEDQKSYICSVGIARYFKENVQ